MRTGHNSSDDFAVAIEEVEDDLHSNASRQVRKSLLHYQLIQAEGMKSIRTLKSIRMLCKRNMCDVILKILASVATET